MGQVSLHGYCYCFSAGLMGDLALIAFTVRNLSVILFWFGMADTPLGRDPPGRHPPSPREGPLQHPTGMHYCYCVCLVCVVYVWGGGGEGMVWAD